MATHQQIANVTDQELVERMIRSHADRFDDVFWAYFDEHVRPGLPGTPTCLDIGCGPGLYLRDLSRRFPGANLVGTDVTQAMLDYAAGLEFEGGSPALHLHDVTTAPLPAADNSVDLVSMVAVLHVLPDPVSVLREVRRVLAPGGRFLLQDWIRTPLTAYLERMVPEDLDPASRAAAMARLIPLFTVHNKFTIDDWLWVLAQGGFEVEVHRQLRSPHFCTFVCKSA
ncbi:MAG: class I SAM-dependent methyltransferase [Pseudomonadales bacterium]|nr:class I SAM-dependent methyltransferase [Pseudomonadales bacterium]